MISLVAAALSAPTALRTLRGAAVLAQLTASTAAGTPSWTRRVLVPTSEHLVSLSLAGTTTRAREYQPSAGNARGGIVLLHGAHPRGIDERRLQAFARSLAGAGLVVLTPELPELMRYRIDADTTERIAAAAHVHAKRLGTRAVGVLGISFAGGLALIAAAEQHGKAPIAFVVTVGAHHDLMRLCRYYAGQHVRGPSGEAVTVAPHPYGARVLMREHLDRFVDASDLPLAERALDTYLRDRHSAAKTQALQLSAAGQATMSVLLGSDSSPALHEMLLEAANAAAPALAAASPKGHLKKLEVPVFLVHGEGDPIIPSIETRWLAREVPKARLARVVVTPLLRHAEFPNAPSPGEQWEVVSLMSAILAEAEASHVRR